MGKKYAPLSSFYQFPLQNPGPFIFYKSLLGKKYYGANIVASYGSKYLTGASSLISQNYSRGKQSIDHVLKILQQMANYEAAKEEKVLSELNKKLGSNKEETLPSPLTEPYAFIAKLNILIKGKEAATIQLQQELNRIRDAKDQFKNKTKEQINKEITENGELATLLHNMSNELEGIGKKSGHFTQYTGFGKTNSMSSKIINKVMSTYGPKIIGLGGDLGKIDGRAINTAAGLITTELQKHIYQKHGKVTQKLVDSYLSKIEHKDKEIDDIINNLTKDNSSFLSLIKSVEENLIDFDRYETALEDNKAIARARTIAKQLVPSIKASYPEKDDKEIAKLARQYGREIVAATHSITPKLYINAEIIGASELQQMFTKAIVTGKSTKDDIGTIYVTVDDDFQTQLSPYTEQMTDLWEHAMKSKTYKKGLAQEYSDNAKITENLFSEMENTLQQASKELDIDIVELKKLLNLVVFHGNVKSYDTIDTKTKAFSGGSIGANIREQLMNFANLLSLSDYGFSNKDSAWLLSAVINTGKGLLGEEQKGPLEQYFSSLMGLLLFDDAYFTMQQGVQYLDQQLETSTIQNIHLYLLNSQYVPASFILQATYDQLKNINSIIAKHGVKATIVSRPAQNTAFTDPQDWISERDSAIEEAEIKVEFMAHFLSFLDDLANAFKV